MAQLMPLLLTNSCSRKSRLVLAFWCQLCRVVQDRIQEGRKTVVIVCVQIIWIATHLVSTDWSPCICHYSFFWSSSHNLLIWLHWIPTEYRANFKTANITFHTLHFSQSAYLHLALHVHLSTHSLWSSNTNLLSVPFIGTSTGTRSSLNAYQLYLPPSPQDPQFPANLPIQLAPSSCASDSALADNCVHLQIIFTYLLQCWLGTGIGQPT